MLKTDLGSLKRYPTRKTSEWMVMNISQPPDRLLKKNGNYMMAVDVIYIKKV